MAGTVPPPPPKLTGDMNRDFAAMVQWVYDFYNAAVVQGYFANSDDVEEQIQEQVDPAQATAATAQQTANTALANTINLDSRVDRLELECAGEFTISGAATTSTITIGVEQPDTDYYVTFGGVEYTGSPALAAFSVVDVNKTVDDFQVTVNTAPGVGNSVKIAWHLKRKSRLQP